MNDALDNNGFNIDPEIINPDSVGKRRDHWIELYTMWNDLIGHLNSLSYRSEWQSELLERLDVASTLLGRMLVREFDPTNYARVINQIGKRAEDVGDGKNDI